MIEDAIARAWAAYSIDVVPADAGTVQIEETKRAFYAGVAALFALMVELGDDEQDEGDVNAQVEAIAAELEKFRESLETDETPNRL